MQTPVHILATVRKPELLKAALLVFRTLRVGFPTQPVFVWGNGLDADSAAVLANVAAGRGAQFRNIPATSHDAWIEKCVSALNEPFWILDTDVVFFAPMEICKLGAFAGRYEPAFNEEFTDTIHVARLHTAVMWIDPAGLRCEMRKWMAKIPAPWRDSAQFALLRQNFVPQATGGTLFYDTMAGCYQAFGEDHGWEFQERDNEAFEHIHCATYADEVVKQAPSLKHLQLVHDRVYANPAEGRGLAKAQAEYYASRKPK